MHGIIAREAYYFSTFLLDKEIESEMLQRMQIQIHSCEILIPYRHAHPDVAVIVK